MRTPPALEFTFHPTARPAQPILRNGGHVTITEHATTQHIPISSIRIPDNHVGADIEHIDTLVRILRDQPHTDLEPVLVTPTRTDDDVHWLINGRHRYIAHIIAGRDTILATIANVTITGEQP